MALGVPRGDEPAHRVADHHDRQVAASMLDHGAQVVDDGLEVLDERLLAVRAAVADVVGADDERAAGDQRLRDVLVPADVLAVAVHEHDEPRGVLGGPAAHLHPTDRRHGVARGHFGCGSWERMSASHARSGVTRRWAIMRCADGVTR